MQLTHLYFKRIRYGWSVFMSKSASWWTLLPNFSERHSVTSTDLQQHICAFHFINSYSQSNWSFQKKIKGIQEFPTKGLRPILIFQQQQHPHNSSTSRRIQFFSSNREIVKTLPEKVPFIGLPNSPISVMSTLNSFQSQGNNDGRCTRLGNGLLKESIHPIWNMNNIQVQPFTRARC